MTTKSEDRTTVPRAMREMVRRRSGRFAVPAFTMLELMIATVVLLLILGITGAIYKSANDAMQLNNASLYVNEDFSTLIRNIKPAMEGISPDGYLVIYGREYSTDLIEKTPTGKIAYTTSGTNPMPSVRSDVLSFFTTGKFRSAIDTNVSSNGAWCYIGHAGQIVSNPPNLYGRTPSDPNLLIVNRWVLSKYVLLLTPGLNTTGNFYKDYRDTSIGRFSTFTTQALSAYTQASDICSWFHRNWIDDTSQTPRNWHVPPYVSLDPNDPNNPGDPNNPDDPRTVTFPYMLPNCGSFRVQFAMPASFAATTGSNDQPEMDNNGQIIWRDALDPTGDSSVSLGSQGINVSPVTNGSLVVFRPNDPWPLLIRIVIRLYDENLSVTSEEPAEFDPQRRVHGGTTVDYVFRLSPKQ